MVADTGTLTQILNQFDAVFSVGRSAVARDAMSLLSLLVVLEVTLAALWLMFTDRNPLAPFLKKVIAIGFFIFIVQGIGNGTFLRQVVGGFIHTGIRAGGGSAATAVAIDDPSSIIDAGFHAAAPLFEYISSFTGPAVLARIHYIIILGLCGLAIVFCYFLIAIQCFLTLIEFGILAALGLIMIPFGVFRHTAFMAERVFGGIIAFGVKLMVLTFLIYVTFPIIRAFSLPVEPTWNHALQLCGAILAISVLVWHAPGVAAGMLSGSPVLTTSNVAGAAFAAAAAGTGLALAGSAAVRGTVTATRAAASAAGAVTQAARHGRASGVGAFAGIASFAGTRVREGLANIGGIRKAFHAGRRHAYMATGGPTPDSGAGMDGTGSTSASSVSTSSPAAGHVNDRASGGTLRAQAPSGGHTPERIVVETERETNPSRKPLWADKVRDIAAARSIIPHEATPHGGMNVPLEKGEHDG